MNRLRRYDRLATRSPEALRRTAWQHLIRPNRDTEWGRARDFARFRDMDDFLAGHPLTTWENYEELVRTRIVEAGVHRDVLRRGAIDGLFRTSGSTGEPKLIPYNLGVHVADVLLGEQISDRWPARSVEGGDDGRVLILRTWRPRHTTDHGLPIHVLGSAQEFEHLAAVRRMLARRLIVPEAVERVDAYDVRLWLAALFALAEPDLVQIQSAFVTAVRDLLGLVEGELDALAATLRTGRPPERIAEAAPGVALPRSDPARADLVQAVFADGVHGWVPRIWPRIRRVRAIATGTFAIHLPHVRHALGDTPVVSATYAASEGILAYADPETGAFQPNLVSHFFEFIPLESDGGSDVGSDDASDGGSGGGSGDAAGGSESTGGDDDARALPLEAVEPGRRYEPVVTTAQGLYRYRMGDVVEVVDRRGVLPLFQVVGRSGEGLNLRGEKVSAATLAELLQDRLGTAAVDFAVRPDASRTPCRYVVLLEVAAGRAADPETLADDLESRLQAREAGYEEARKRDLLAAVELHLVDPGTFAALRARRAAAADTPITRQKLPRVLGPEEDDARRFLESRRTGSRT